MTMDFAKLYIDGGWADPAGSELLDVINPATETPIASVPRGTAADIDRAVRAAAAAFPRWSTTTAADRKRYLRAIAAELRARAPAVADTIVAELGMPVDATLAVQVLGAAEILENYADEIGSLTWEHKLGNSLVVKEPVGVAGAITPWNYPLYQIAAKAGAALAAGCTVVIKPSELTPLNAFHLAAAAEAAGLPPGVINLVTGTGPEAGEALAGHPGIDMISLTGSTRSGRRVAELASRGLKPAALELGGKSASIILDDADLETAVRAVLRNCCRNSGQACSAQSRLLVPRHLLTRAAQAAADAAAALRLGDPADHGDHLGPLISATQRDRVRAVIDQAVADGCSLIAGGSSDPAGFPVGYYVQPTIFTDVAPGAAIAQAEVFGPVLCLIGYQSVQDAIAIANDTPYGLSGGVWSSSSERALAAARSLRTGEVQINGAPFNVRAPFGGYKQSGYGRELGPYGIEEYLQTKAIHL
jgi:acyl-CoA reductase-like NAD-dependent aldehyde dehydrogenase